jgi:exonuclease SbcC
MSQIDESFETIQRSLRSILPDQESYQLRRLDHALVLNMQSDVAAFSVFNGDVQEEFDAAYREFKALYREHHVEWDKRTLSFVLCRVSENPEDDRFYAEREHDPLFCRKYVIHAHKEVGKQSEELLRLPFLPFPDEGTLQLRRPRSAQDLLQSAGIAASLARKLVEPRQRAPEGIVEDLLRGKETLPEALVAQKTTNVTLVKPRQVSRLTHATVQSFRAYGGPQTFDLDASVVVLYGPNGLGKTSFFDAIDYACTGRIGRLCRQRKLNQEDFSRVATHLDETAGTGSVLLRGTAGQDANNLSEWTLRRGTGNWSTAWIDDAKQDRLSTLTFLTNADWGEGKPRQQNIESLFRATHLFGQDEQELLSDFRKSSMLPEAFVSEMLALQDYSQGLDKAQAVSQVLEKKKDSLKAQIKSIEVEKASLNTSISEVDGSHTQATIDQLAAEIRKKSLARAGKPKFPDDPITLATLSDWIEFASAQSESANRRVQNAKAAKADLPILGQAGERIAACTTQLASLDAELKAIAEEREALQKSGTQARTRLTSTTSARIELDRRKREMDAAKQWSESRSEHEKRVEQSRVDQTNAKKELDSLATLFSSIETDLQALSSEREALSQAIESLESQLKLHARAQAAFPNHIEYRRSYKQASAELDEVNRHRTSLDGQFPQLRDRALAAEAQRKQLQPAYDRARSRQKELDNLLDAIQTHLSGCECPLCGTDFSTNEALVDRISHHRNNASSEPSLSTEYASLKAAEEKAQDALSKTLAEADALGTRADSLRSRINELADSDVAFLSLVKSLLGQDITSVDQGLLNACKKELQTKYEALTRQGVQVSGKIAMLQEQQQANWKQQSKLRSRMNELVANCKSVEDELLRGDGRYRDVLAAEQINEADVESTIGKLQSEMQQVLESEEALRRTIEQQSTSLQEADTRLTDIQKRRQSLTDELQKAQVTEVKMRSRLGDLQLTEAVEEIDEAIATLEADATQMRKAIADARVLEVALMGMESKRQNDQIKKQIDKLISEVQKLTGTLKTTESHLACLRSIESLLSRERQSAVANHISAYGPLISNIQQRLRSVYGFGGVHLDARGGEVAVKVEWRNKDVHLRPTDFFSDSQKQILMLSVFLAGGLRQNWSGFAPVLLDDPVTHFDDLNAYAFVELIRGIVSPNPNEWQFIISTCEDRLFSLMQKKFTRLGNGAIFYEFLGMSDDGPIIERR